MHIHRSQNISPLRPRHAHVPPHSEAPHLSRLSAAGVRPCCRPSYTPPPTNSLSFCSSARSARDLIGMSFGLHRTSARLPFSLYTRPACTTHACREHWRPGSVQGRLHRREPPAAAAASPRAPAAAAQSDATARSRPPACRRPRRTGRDRRRWACRTFGRTSFSTSGAASALLIPQPARLANRPV